MKKEWNAPEVATLEFEKTETPRFKAMDLVKLTTSTGSLAADTFTLASIENNARLES